MLVDPGKIGVSIVKIFAVQFVMLGIIGFFLFAL